MLNKLTVKNVALIESAEIEFTKGFNVLSGETGSGKSTVANLLARFYDVDSGSVRIDGTDVRDLSIASLRSLIGVVGQTHIVGSNVLYFELADGSSFIIRPSGTEPKIKVYLLVHDADKAKCEEKIARFAAYAESLKEL